MDAHSRFASVGVRRAAVADLFYPGDAATLMRDVDAALAAAAPALAPGIPKAMIVPHAGYIYSGPIAAAAYARLAPARDVVKRVVLLGPCHRVPVRGLALPEAAAFETPLGRVDVDVRAAALLAGLPQVHASAAAHAEEHALEVQLPFLQRVLGDFAIVPFVVGAASKDEVADVIERLYGGPETLVLVSSDLSHYHRYDDARAIDAATVQSILDLAASLDHEQACGATPITGLLEVARRRKLVPELLDLRNSGDTAGDRRRVVGYAAFAFWDGGRPARYGEEHGRTLLEVARGAIGNALGRAAPARPDAPWLGERRASFVTLRQGEELRGCIGSLTARRALGDDVAANAHAAAFADPRFGPLADHEFDRTDIEVSLLSRAAAIVFANHADLCARLAPGEDGVILECGERRATFLPQVWDQLPDPDAFLAHLKRKAGLSADHPTERCTIQRYRVLKWTERELGNV